MSSSTFSNSGTFAVGDVVRLKCGGPAMVVHSKDTRANVLYCVWISDYCGRCDGHFLPSTLVFEDDEREAQAKAEEKKAADSPKPLG